MNCIKTSEKKKIQKQKNIMKSNLNHIITIYLHWLERQKILTTKQYFEDNIKNFRLVQQTIKGIINMKKKSDKSISTLMKKLTNV